MAGRGPRKNVKPSSASMLARYSRFVGLMKMVLPASAAALLGLILVWPNLSSRESAFFMSLGNISFRDVDTQSMQNPRYHGTDDSNLPFAVTADVATQVDPINSVVSLENPAADIARKGGGQIILNAEMGLFRQKDDLLDLIGGVGLYQNDGYELHTDSVRVNIKENAITGDAPTNGQGPGGTIEGEGIRVWEGGNRIMFTGKTKAVLFAGKPGSKR